MLRLVTLDAPLSRWVAVCRCQPIIALCNGVVCYVCIQQLCGLVYMYTYANIYIFLDIYCLCVIYRTPAKMAKM